MKEIALPYEAHRLLFDSHGMRPRLLLIVGTPDPRDFNAIGAVQTLITPAHISDSSKLGRTCRSLQDPTSSFFYHHPKVIVIIPSIH